MVEVVEVGQCDRPNTVRKAEIQRTILESRCVLAVFSNFPQNALLQFNGNFEFSQIYNV